MALGGSTTSLVHNCKTYIYIYIYIYIDVALFSETHLKFHDRFHIQNYHFYRIDCHPETKGETAFAVRKGIPHMHVDLPPLVSVEATGVCIPTGNQKVLLTAVYKSPGRIWKDADITELLRFRHKCILAGDLNAKHTSWNRLRKINNRPDLSSEREPHGDKTTTFRKQPSDRKLYQVISRRVGSIP
jgi:hypothetical protein